MKPILNVHWFRKISLHTKFLGVVPIGLAIVIALLSGIGTVSRYVLGSLQLMLLDFSRGSI